MAATGSESATNSTPEPAKKGSNKPALRRKLSRRRKWLFRLLAMTLAPALLIGGLEIALWIAGYGTSTDFFVDGSAVENSDVWIENPDFGRRFFPSGLKQVPQPLQFVLPKSKKAGVYRIFVLGESAAQGFPDPSTSFARILEVMLRARYPDTRFEVVNTSMVAINSHVALSIARQCAERKPDLFVVHLGNNEVIGPFGGAGVLGPFADNVRLLRANLAIKTTRTGQLINKVVHSIREKPAPKNWDGMAMFVNSHMRATDRHLGEIYGLFRANLEEICRNGKGADIPVILCTIPVNLKDCAPFGSLHAAGIGEMEAWDALFHQGIERQKEGKFKEAIECFEQAKQLDDEFAELAFRQGQCYQALADNSKANECFVRARDLDTLRFRSDSTINKVIREVANDQGSSDVRLANAVQDFADNSPAGIPGEELFLEHVHMTFKGNYLLARSVFEAITNPAPAALGNPSQERKTLSESECAERLAQTEWNEWEFGNRIYERLIQGPPFTLQFDHQERSKRLKDRLSAIRHHLRMGGIKKACSEYEKAIKLNENDWMIRQNYAQLLMQTGNLSAAKQQYLEVVSSVRHSFAGHFMLGTVELKLKMKNPITAEQAFRAALQYVPESVEASIGLAMALEEQGKEKEAFALYEEMHRKDTNNALVCEEFGQFLFRGGKLKEAEQIFQTALQLAPESHAAKVGLAMVFEKQGKVDDARSRFEEMMSLDPNNAQVLKSFVRFLHRIGNLEEASARLLEALRRDPDSSDIRVDLGMTALEQKKIDEAIGYFEDALRIQPDLPELREYMAHLRKQRDEKKRSP